MQKIIIDCDTGLDDMVALIMAYASDDLDVLAVISTYGNISLANTYRNNKALSKALKSKAKQFIGSKEPLVRQLVDASDVHGSTGLGGTKFKDSKTKDQKQSGINYLIDTLLKNPGEISLIFIGPLTDLAIAYKADNRIKDLAKEIVIMGGSLEKGNASKYAEFNIYADPESAKIVFDNFSNITLFPLDLTHKLLLDEVLLSYYEGQYKGFLINQFVNGMKYYRDRVRELSHTSDPAMHDPCPIAYLLDKTIFEYKEIKLSVNTDANSEFYGQTYKETKGNSINVALNANKAAFFHLLEKSLEKISNK